MVRFLLRFPESKLIEREVFGHQGHKPRKTELRGGVLAPQRLFGEGFFTNV